MSLNNSVPGVCRGLTHVLAVIVCLLGTVEVFGGVRRATTLGPVATLDVYADLDGDGRVDIASASRGANATIDIFASHQAQRPQQIDTTVPLLGLIATDIDRDGDPDLVALNRAGALTVWINYGQGRFLPQQPRPPTATQPITSFDLSSLATGLPLAYVGRTRLDLDGSAAAADARAARLPAEAAPRRLSPPYTSIALAILATRGPPRRLLRA